MPQHETPKLPKFYLHFKERLLKMMTIADPLEILESSIFQQFQSVLINAKQQLQIPINYQTKISSYHLQTSSEVIGYQLIQRRSKSVDKFDQDDRYETRKVRMLEQQNKVDHCIWSNILNNLFVPKAQYQRLEQTLKLNSQGATLQKSNVCKNRNQEVGNQTNNLKYKIEETYIDKQNVCSNTKSYIDSQKETNYIDTIFDCVQKQLIKHKRQDSGDIQLTRSVLYQGRQKLGKQLQLLHETMGTLKNTNERLMNQAKNHSFRELQFIIKSKQYEKTISKLKQQLHTLQLNSENQEQVFQQQYEKFKGNVFETFRGVLDGADPTKLHQKSNIEELREKIMIESFRRNMLVGVDRQKLDLQLKKQEFGFHNQLYRNQEYRQQVANQEQTHQQTWDTES